MPTVHIEARKEDIAKTVLMPGDPKRAEYIAKNYLKKAKLVNLVRGITYYNNKIMFVKNALEGEIVEAAIKKEYSKYIEAEATEIIKKSKIRIKEECPYSKECGGCHLNHMTYH